MGTRETHTTRPHEQERRVVTGPPAAGIRGVVTDSDASEGCETTRTSSRAARVAKKKTMLILED